MLNLTVSFLHFIFNLLFSVFDSLDSILYWSVPHLPAIRSLQHGNLVQDVIAHGKTVQKIDYCRMANSAANWFQPFSLISGRPNLETWWPRSIFGLISGPLNSKTWGDPANFKYFHPNICWQFGDANPCRVAMETNWVTELRQETPLKRPKEKVAVLGH